MMMRKFYTVPGLWVVVAHESDTIGIIRYNMDAAEGMLRWCESKSGFGADAQSYIIIYNILAIFTYYYVIAIRWHYYTTYLYYTSTTDCTYT